MHVEVKNASTAALPQPLQRICSLCESTYSLLYQKCEEFQKNTSIPTEYTNNTTTGTVAQVQGAA